MKKLLKKGLTLILVTTLVVGVVSNTVSAVGDSVLRADIKARIESEIRSKYWRRNICTIEYIEEYHKSQFNTIVYLRLTDSQGCTFDDSVEIVTTFDQQRIEKTLRRKYKKITSLTILAIDQITPSCACVAVEITDKTRGKFIDAVDFDNLLVLELIFPHRAYHLFD